MHNACNGCIVPRESMLVSQSTDILAVADPVLNLNATETTQVATEAARGLVDPQYHACRPGQGCKDGLPIQLI